MRMSDGSSDVCSSDLKGLPVIGVARDLRRDPLRYFVDLMLRYGDVVWFRIGPAEIVMLNDPDAVRRVLQDNNRNYHQSRFYESFRPARKSVEKGKSVSVRVDNGGRRSIKKKNQ